MRYFRLTDVLNDGVVVRECESGIGYEEARFVDGRIEWEWFDMTDYWHPDGDVYGCFEEITEKEADTANERRRASLYRIKRIAENVAFELHEGQVDKAGKPYYLHVQFVAKAQSDVECAIVAWLHDTLEDTETTEDELLEIFPKRIVEYVKILTRGKAENYMEYIERVSMEYVTREVKKADLRHNMDLSRLPVIAEKDYERIAKYEKALSILEKATA